MEKISLGLDIGTNSVGWAVVDENNNIVKKNKFALWGVRMFDDANTAKDRRVFRCSRRRLRRRKQRINLLQQEFYDEINKVDPKFFQRLNDSFYKKEDKFNNYTFFDDAVTDRDFFKKYPTIFHLRNHLIESNQKADIRELYLALHHMIKYRGHFLRDDSYENFNLKDNSSIINSLTEIKTALQEMDNQFDEIFEDKQILSDYFAFDDEVVIDDEFCENLKNIIISKKGKKEKEKDLADLFHYKSKSFMAEFVIELLLKKSCNTESLSIVKDQKLEKAPIDLESAELEYQLNAAKQTVTQLAHLFDLVLPIKEISDTFYLINLLNNSQYLSESMVKMYDEHKVQLKNLKYLVKTYTSQAQYDECFRLVKEKVNNYPHYIGMNSSKKDNTHVNRTRYSHCTKEDFYKYLNQVFAQIEKNSSLTEDDAALLQSLKNAKDQGTLLCRQSSGQNTVIPHQLHEKELVQILKNQVQYYDFLTQEKDGLTVTDRIISIFEFKVPYYVGPLTNERNSKFAWCVKKSDEQIKPWNFKDIIDEDESAKKFINRMQNKCTYLKGDEDYCLPKKSLLFSEYNCLSFLNKLKINGALISKSLKEKLYNEVFLKISKPSKKDVTEYVKNNEYAATEEDLTKIPNVTCDMSSYIKFKEIFGDEFESRKNDIEEIIKDITIFEDKKILEKRLREIYNLDEDKVKQIKGLNYQGYGALSKHLLSGLVACNKQTGEVSGPIIQIMRDTNESLQEIIYGNYGYEDAIDEYNKGAINTDLSYQDFIEEYIYTSPSMKRALIQSYQIIEEVEKILGRPIDYYYIECTRSNQQSNKEKASRYENVKTLLDDCKKIAKDLAQFNIDVNKLTDKLESYKNNLQSDKYYFYFTQLGKCLYTFEDIDISSVNNSSLWDIDHIYPRSMVKDDSLSNRVLVSKTFNQNIKNDNFLCDAKRNQSPELVAKLEKFYKILLDKKLISKGKYYRLTQREVSPTDLAGFANRQKVVTDQSAKGLIELLKQYKKIRPTHIIWSKGENVSDFRNDYDILKSRTANNFHHAHDAYLNVVVGRVIDTYFKENHVDNKMTYEELKARKITTNPQRILAKDRFVFKDGQKWYFWKIEDIKNVVAPTVKNRFDISESTMTFESTELYPQVTIKPAGQGNIPVKTTNKLVDTTKYGGLKSDGFAKYMIIKTTDKKGKINYILEAIPKAACNKDINAYLNKIYQNQQFEVVCDTIKVNCTLELENRKFFITGKTNKQYVLKNAIDRYFNYDIVKTIKHMDKYQDFVKFGKEVTITDNEISFVVKKNKEEKEIKITKGELLNILEDIMNKYDKNIYSYSNIIAINDVLKSTNFSLLSMPDLMTVTYNLLQLLKTNERKSIDLTLIGGASKSGALLMSKTLKPGTKFIHTSVTGYYKKVLFEVPSGI